jgi:D-alanyl-D-alanine dipeptidase
MLGDELLKTKLAQLIITIFLILPTLLIVIETTTYAAPKKIFSINNLVRLNDFDKSISINLKYATKNNFTHRVLYNNATPVLNINTVKKLINANNYLKKFGFHIEVYDAYRPYDIQKLMWRLCPDKKYLADPKKGSNHNRGAAVDVTIVDNKGIEAIMPSSFDEFSIRSHIDYKKTSKKAIANRELLATAMLKCGFKRISTEWWHFDDIDYKKYPIQNISLDKFTK